MQRNLQPARKQHGRAKGQEGGDQERPRRQFALRRAQARPDQERRRQAQVRVPVRRPPEGPLRGPSFRKRVL